MSLTTKAGVALALAAASGALIVGGAALADATTGKAPSVTQQAGGYADGSEGQGTGRGGSGDTPVTGDELAKVTAAVKAKDSAVTVTGVRKDPDGSYDVLGTKAGAQVMYDVSADLKRFTANTGGHGGGAGHGVDGPSSGTSGSSGTSSSSGSSGA